MQCTYCGSHSSYQQDFVQFCSQIDHTILWWGHSKEEVRQLPAGDVVLHPFYEVSYLALSYAQIYRPGWYKQVTLMSSCCPCILTVCCWCFSSRKCVSSVWGTVLDIWKLPTANHLQAIYKIFLYTAAKIKLMDNLSPTCLLNKLHIQMKTEKLLTSAFDWQTQMWESRIEYLADFLSNI